MQFGADGVPRAWYPRREMARELGLSEYTVRNAIQDLRKLGFLEVEQAGRKGAATTYKVMPDSPILQSKGTAVANPKGPKGYLSEVPKGTPRKVPPKNKEIGRGHEAAPPKRGQGCDVDARGALDAPAQRVKSGAEFLAEYLGEGVEDGG